MSSPQVPDSIANGYLGQTPFRIRRFQPGDESAVWDLHVLGLEHVSAYSGPGPWDDDLRDVEGSYLQVSGEFLVVVLNNAIVGMGGLRPTSLNTAEIKRMRVHPQFHRRGIGEAIYDHLEKRARELSYEKLVLDTTVQQTAAQALYLKKGFSETGRTVMGGFDCILFEKDLSAEVAAGGLTKVDPKT